MKSPKNRKGTFMTVDPSINNLGMAIYSNSKLFEHALVHPDKESKSQGEHMLKTYSLLQTLKALVNKYLVEEIVLEVPEYWGEAGYVARESGSIMKMMFLCGAVFCGFKDLGLSVECVTPRQWKGQLPKDVVRNRLAPTFVPRYFDQQEWKKLDHNIMDAIAIGHFWVTGRV